MQEALANAQRHAQAKNVQVRFHVDGSCAMLSIRDDGRGFALPDSLGESARRGYFGLLGIRERVEFIHGRLEISSSPGDGCLVQVEIPLDTGGGRNDDVRIQ